MKPERAPEDLAEPVEFHGIQTRSPALVRVFRIVERAARSDARVLLRGETGTGKELLARALHDLSPRKSGPLHAINCAALPPTLLESELFGHVRGAFTGAVRDHIGHFQRAHRGTLFLDEVAELPLDLQAKLLRVLETQTVIPVGGREPVPVDVRIVTATHRGLRGEVEAGRFRADLMYRLRVVPIFLPPLRERRGDILLLAQRFIAQQNELAAWRGERRIERISPAAQARLLSHDWHGNVRELHNVIEYAFVIGEDSELQEADLPPEFGEEAAAEDQEPGDPADLPGVLAAATPAAEAERIQAALALHQGQRAAAAAHLGMSRVTLWRRMRALGLA